jgi:hypothetical protein
MYFISWANYYSKDLQDIPSLPNKCCKATMLDFGNKIILSIERKKTIWSRVANVTILLPMHREGYSDLFKFLLRYWNLLRKLIVAFLFLRFLHLKIHYRN